MRVGERLRTMACCVVLEWGTLMGVPMRPEQIQRLMHAMNVPTIARTDPDASAAGDTPDPGVPSG